MDSNVTDIVSRKKILVGNPDKRLTGKQKKFVEEYLIDLNGRQAAIRAGYSENGSEKTAYELLRKPHIDKALRERQEKAIKKSHVTPEWVLGKIAKTITAAELEGKHNEVLRGCELLGRHYSLFVDRTEVTGKDGEAIQYEKTKEDADEFTNNLLNLAQRSKSKKA